MRIKSVAIKNLRSIKEATIDLDGYTCLVGPNGAGKSTLLCALNIFFRETENATTDLVFLVAEDFHQRVTTKPIEVTVTFIELSPSAQEDFKDYFRHGQLIVSAVAAFNVDTGRAEVKQYGQRLAMAPFKPFFKASGDNEKVAVLKELYSQLRHQFPELAGAGTKDGMTETLRAYEAARPELCELIPSEDQFYGVSKGSNRLQQYIQWVYVPAVKDATKEQLEAKNTALGRLLARTVRATVNFESAVKALQDEARGKYDELLGQNQAALDSISASLKDRLAHWAHPEASLRLTWQQDPSKSVRVEEPFAKLIVGEGDFEGELSRFGHGFQRSYLLALLQELASSDDENAPRLILGCEEPELYQHPPQARHLAAILHKLGQGNAQVIVTTHSPYFVTGEHFENVRMVRRDSTAKCSNIRQLTHQEIADRYATVVGESIPTPSAGMAKVHQTLQASLSEMFFTQRLVLVEGLEDAAYINAWLSLTDRMEDFRRTGCHIVPVNKKSEMIRPLIIAQGLDIPVFALFDGDNDKLKKPDHQQAHERDNRALLLLLDGDVTKLFPMDTVWAMNFAMWPTDIGQLVDADLKNSLGAAKFDQIRNIVHAGYDCNGGMKKTTMLVNSKLVLAWEAEGKSSTLDTLCDSLIAFGKAPMYP